VRPSFPAHEDVSLLRARILALALLALPPVPARAVDDLAARLDRALAAPALRGARVGALVVSLDDGRELFARRADEPAVPASNQKILTALAALETFGPAYRFRTALLADRKPDASGAIGTLYVIGGGDPGLTSERWWRLAAELRAIGLARVRDVVVDDGHFDRERWHPSWGAVSSRPYHAPVGALNANYGAFTTWVQAGPKPGDPLAVRVDPPIPYFEIVNRGHTGRRGGRYRFQVERRAGALGESVVVSGSLPAGAPAQPVARSVLDPIRYAGALLRAQLLAVGVEVTGEVRVAPAPVGASHLHDFYGATLGELLLTFLKTSNNNIGETLCKDLALAQGAARGNWSQGAAALREDLERLGLPLAGAVLVDGSGLSYENRVAPRTLVAALVLARRRFGVAPELLAALPIAGTDGTLRRRAKGARGRVRAKTGLLTGVVALSGYALGPDGRERVFSVLVNGFRGYPRGAMDALDAFAVALTK
jgi:D-alanyl-D-alanine carboxypeptidase/D-alanyl-D-alanine-endopeptidase (penicillin-binding protein 4)